MYISIRRKVIKGNTSYSIHIQDTIHETQSIVADSCDTFLSTSRSWNLIIPCEYNSMYSISTYVYVWDVYYVCSP